jgi:hypothetical protein
LGAAIPTASGCSDGLQERRLAKAVLPDKDGPHSRLPVRANKVELHVLKELDVLYVEMP